VKINVKILELKILAKAAPQTGKDTKDTKNAKDAVQ